MYFGPALHPAQQYQLPPGLPVAPGEPQGAIDVGSILSTLVRRRRLVIAIFVGFVSAVLLVTLLIPKTYTATTKMIAGGSSARTVPGDTSALPLLNALLAANQAQTPETYVDLIQQEPVVRQVSENLALHMGVGPLLDHIQVTPVTNTAIINLSATWWDRETAARIANEFATVFITRERDLIAGQATSAIDFLNKEMPAAEVRMHAADDVLVRFQTAHPNVYINTTGQGESTVSTAQQKYAQAQVDMEQAQAQLNSVTAQLGSMSPTINGSSNIIINPVVGQLQTQLAQVEVQLESARKQYTEQHPTVQALEEQKAQLEREIRSQPATEVAGNNIVPNPVYEALNQQAATLHSQIAGDQGQIKTLNAELGAMNGQANSLPSETLTLANLQRKAKMAEDIYTALQQKYSEAIVARTTALSDIAVTEPASAATAAVKPNLLLNLVIGVVLGLVLAVSGAFVVDFFDNTFKDEQDVQRALPLPLLTTVPQLDAAAPAQLPWLRALTVEAFQQLVTALRYSSDQPLRTLAIMSPNQSDGKSTVAMSTAIAMAEIEPNVVLIDADMRRPSLHELFGLPGDPGLSDVLIGAVPVTEALQRTKYDGLSLLSCGTKVPNPIKLLHSARLEELLSALLKEHRIAVLDTPALLPVYDAAIIGTKVDGAVIVVAAGMTDMPSTKKALQRLGSVQGINLLGVVLNRATPTNGYQAYYLNVDGHTPLPHEDGIISSS